MGAPKGMSRPMKVSDGSSLPTTRLLIIMLKVGNIVVRIRLVGIIIVIIIQDRGGGGGGGTVT